MLFSVKTIKRSCSIMITWADPWRLYYSPIIKNPTIALSFSMSLTMRNCNVFSVINWTITLYNKLCWSSLGEWKRSPPILLSKSSIQSSSSSSFSSNNVQSYITWTMRIEQHLEGIICLRASRAKRNGRKWSLLDWVLLIEASDDRARDLNKL